MSKLKKTTIYFIIFVCIAMAYSLLEPFWIRVKTLEIHDEDIPPSFKNAKIVFVSDIHHGPFFSRNRIKKLVERINSLTPDIILFGGDYVHRSSKYIEPCFEEMSSLESKHGVFGVLGNHDHWESAELTVKNMEMAEITVLDNKAVWVNNGEDRIKIGGVGDIFEDSQDINPTIEDVSENDFVMLLSHNPDYAEKIHTSKIDIVLSGHTHGGQVTFFGLWAPIVPSEYGQKYRTGTVDTGYTKVLLTNGVGTITPPVRFFARPEIILIELK